MLRVYFCVFFSYTINRYKIYTMVQGVRMKKILSFFTACIMAVFSFTPAFALTPDLSTYSEAYVVIDAKTGQVLIEKNMDQREFPASITKVMTAALGLVYGDPDDIITISEETVNDIWQWGETTHIALEPGEMITLRDALSGAMIESANDCADAIAQDVSGNLEEFAVLMNKQVTALGLSNTHFTNAHGLPDDDHYTTAYDMAMITRWALTVDGFSDYFGALSYTIPANNKKDTVRNIGTHHHMLVDSAYYYEYSRGGKLGWTTEANHTIVTWAEKDGLSLICVCLNCPDKWGKYKDSIALFDYCFEHYGMVSVPAEQVASFHVPTGTVNEPTGTVHIAVAGDLNILVENGVSQSSIALQYDIPSCYKEGEPINPKVLVYSSGKLIGSIPMTYTVESYGTSQEIPQQNNASGGSGSVLLTILKWMVIILAVAAMVLFALRAYFMAQRRKRKKHRRGRTA